MCIKKKSIPPDFDTFYRSVGRAVITSRFAGTTLRFPAILPRTNSTALAELSFNWCRRHFPKENH